MTDKIEISTATADKIIKVLTAHVGDFVCDHSLDICFCDEKEIIRHVKSAKEKRLFTCKTSK